MAESSRRMDVTLSFSFFTFCCGSPTITSRLTLIFFSGSNSPKPFPPFMATFGVLLVSSSDLLSSDLTCKALPFLPARHLMPSAPALPTAKDEETGKQERIKKRTLSIVAAPQRFCMFPLLLMVEMLLPSRSTCTRTRSLLARVSARTFFSLGGPSIDLERMPQGLKSSNSYDRYHGILAPRVREIHYS